MSVSGPPVFVFLYFWSREIDSTCNTSEHMPIGCLLCVGRYYIELEGDSSADLLVSLDSVDANLSPQLGACSLATGSGLGRDELFSGRIRIPAEVLDIPSCGGGCADAFPVPSNAASVSNCDANTPSGRNW